MPVTEAAKRKQQLQALEDRRDHLVKALRDEDWIDRLLDDDFKRFIAKVGEAQVRNKESLKTTIEALSGRLNIAERAQANEELLITQAVISATDDIIHWPEVQSAKLKEARRELPGIEIEIKNLKGKNNE
jgi:hypothetical protein